MADSVSTVSFGKLNTPPMALDVVPPLIHSDVLRMIDVVKAALLDLDCRCRIGQNLRFVLMQLVMKLPAVIPFATSFAEEVIEKNIEQQDISAAVCPPPL
jgi:hypothetical protein